MPWRGPEYQGEFPSLGWDIIDWIEASLTIPDGRHQGDPLKLTQEMAEFVVKLYRLKANGDRVYRRGALVRPKGWGKSPFLGAVALAELAAPVVFDGWDAAGEPVGRPQPTPWIQIASVSEDSTDNTWSAIYQMALGDDFAEQLPGVDVGRTRIYTPRGGSLEAVTSSGDSREGQRITFAVLDETHLWTPSSGGVDLAAVLRRNIAKMDGVSVETTNAPFLGEGSVAEETIEECRRGEVRGVLFDHREAPDVDLKDIPALLAALEHVYGDSYWINKERLAEEIQDGSTTADDAERFYLNRVRSSADKYFDQEAWKARAKPDTEVPPKTLIALGFDGSKFDDATALIGTVVTTGHQFVLGFWEKPLEAGDDWEVPADEVNAAVDDAFATYDVWRLYADPPYWEDTVASWSGRYGAKRVIEWWTMRDRQVAFALRAYRQAQAEGGLSHDGHNGMGRHIGNAVKKRARARDDDGKPMWTISKPKRQSPYKIDAAMAGCLSWEARRDAVAAGKAVERKRRVTVYR